MAYARKRTARRTSTSRGPRRTYSSGRSAQRSYSRRASPRRRSPVRKTRASSGGRTVKIVIEQVAPQTMSPLQQKLLEAGKVVLPRKAQF